MHFRIKLVIVNLGNCQHVPNPLLSSCSTNLSMCYVQLHKQKQGIHRHQTLPWYRNATRLSTVTAFERQNNAIPGYYQILNLY